MQPHHASALGRWLSALVLGERAALFLGALTILVAFWSSARRFYADIAHLEEPTIADKFGAGIWSATAGMLFTIAVRLALTTFWRGGWVGNFPLGIAMMAAGVLVIIVGYFLHFAAWAAVVHPAHRRLPLFWSLAMLVVTIGGTIFALGIY